MLPLSVPVLSEASFKSQTPGTAKGKSLGIFVSMIIKKNQTKKKPHIRFTCTQCGSHFSCLESACHSPQLCEVQLHRNMPVPSKHPFENPGGYNVTRSLEFIYFFLNIGKLFQNSAWNGKGGQKVSMI